MELTFWTTCKQDWSGSAEFAILPNVVQNSQMKLTEKVHAITGTVIKDKNIWINGVILIIMWIMMFVYNVIWAASSPNLEIATVGMQILI